MDIRKLIKECVTQVLKEELEEPLYVEYVSQRPGEQPFMMGNQKFEYVNAKYPNNKIDIGVYAFAGDICYSYNAFREMYNIQEGLTEGGWNNSEPTQYRVHSGGRTIWYANFDHDKHKEIPGMPIFTYTVQHVPTGVKDVKFVACHNQGDFEELMNHWNRQMPSTWKYIPGSMKEGFDATSMGPNPESTEGLSDGNPYASWNAKMRRMEENEHGRYAQEAGAVYNDEISEEHVNPHLIHGEEAKQFVLTYLNHNKAHTQIPIDVIKTSLEGRVDAVEMDRVLQSLQQDGLVRVFGNGRFLKVLPSNSVTEEQTFQQIQDKEDPDGKAHDLTLVCVKCGNTQSCRCSKPKREFKGVCNDCAGKSVNEWDQLDPERRKRQLGARPPGHATKMIKQRSDQMAKDMVARMKQQHGSKS